MKALVAIATISGLMLIAKGASAITANSNILRKRVEKAYTAIGKNTKYASGQGGWYPDDAFPTRTGSCDCSGFGSWVMGERRSNGNRSPSEIETTNIYNDANGKKKFFIKVNKPEPGVFYVYPDKNGNQGHMGLVTRIDGKKIIGVDCGSSNYKRTGDAIQERDLSYMKSEGGIFVILRKDLSDYA